MVNGPRAIGQGNRVLDDNIVPSNLVCLHWGMMTLPWRIQHKERWDRIYEQADPSGMNPYGYWNSMIEGNPEDIPVIPNHYLPHEIDYDFL